MFTIDSLLVAITNYLPMSLATKKMAKRYERKKQEQEGITKSEEEEVDLFSRQRAILHLFII